MKCLIDCNITIEWRKKGFPDTSPLLLSIGNKKVIEYYLDFCIANNINDITIYSNKKSDEIIEFLGCGKKYGVKIFYKTQLIPEDPKYFLESEVELSKNKILLIRGISLLNCITTKFCPHNFFYGKPSIVFDHGQVFVCQPGNDLFPRISSKMLGIEYIPIDSLKTFQDLNLKIQKRPNEHKKILDQKII